MHVSHYVCALPMLNQAPCSKSHHRIRRVYLCMYTRLSLYVCTLCSLSDQACFPRCLARTLPTTNRWSWIARSCDDLQQQSDAWPRRVCISDRQTVHSNEHRYVGRPQLVFWRGGNLRSPAHGGACRATGGARVQGANTGCPFLCCHVAAL